MFLQDKVIDGYGEPSWTSSYICIHNFSILLKYCIIVHFNDLVIQAVRLGYNNKWRINIFKNVQFKF